jgi:hypothetical protein
MDTRTGQLASLRRSNSTRTIHGSRRKALARALPLPARLPDLRGHHGVELRLRRGDDPSRPGPRLGLHRLQRHEAALREARAAGRLSLSPPGRAAYLRYPSTLSRGSSARGRGRPPGAAPRLGGPAAGREGGGGMAIAEGDGFRQRLVTRAPIHHPARSRPAPSPRPPGPARTGGRRGRRSRSGGQSRRR